MKEIDVLLEQLDELLHDPIVDGDDALEVAIVAGLASRLGAPVFALEGSVAWRDGEGRDLLEEGFSAVSLETLVAEVDSLVDEEVEVVEEALSDFDDVVAAALWCGRKSWVEDAETQVATSIRQLPETFSALAALGSSIASLPAVGAQREVYDYWLAVSETAQWSDTNT